jgi:hypothetical protein
MSREARVREAEGKEARKRYIQRKPIGLKQEKNEEQNSPRNQKGRQEKQEIPEKESSIGEVKEDGGRQGRRERDRDMVSMRAKIHYTH